MDDYIEFGEGDRFYRLDSAGDWMNGAYDEDGNGARCDLCGGDLKWNGYEYICRECEHTMSRADYLNYIGANPPGSQCYSCSTNYPFCKKDCFLVYISPDDPMLS